jgi:hypothetical protein
MEHVKDRLQHMLNPLHVYCRLRQLGMAGERAMRMCAVYERYLYRPAFS